MSVAAWHYPRIDFAETVSSLLVSGPIRGVSLFGPRRTGKTQFLTHDLAPLAESRGHRVVYVNLWQTLDSPLAILLHELDLTLREGSVLDRIRSTASDLAPKFTLESPDGSAEIEIDLQNLKGRAPEQHLLLLDRYLARLANTKKPAFLLFDEFQELARATNAAPLVAALRTSLEKHRNGLASVFAGSSQTRLRAMFTAKDAPFLHFATPVQLPRLDAAFVDHQLAVFRAASRAKADREEALSVFERFDHNPLFFQRWLTTLALDPSLSARDAVSLVQADLAEELDFVTLWLGLNATQRVAARLISEHVGHLFGREGAERWRELTGDEAPPPHRIQTAVKKLLRLGVADREQDVWRLSDPVFEAWVKARPASDF